MTTEPVATAAAFQAVIGAVLGLLNVFNVVSLTDAQTGAIFIAYAALIALWSAVTRSKVSPVTKV